MASRCEHTFRPHYSNGLCQNCYLAQYYQKRKKKTIEKSREGKTLEKGNDVSDESV